MACAWARRHSSDCTARNACTSRVFDLYGTDGALQLFPNAERPDDVVEAGATIELGGPQGFAALPVPGSEAERFLVLAAADPTLLGSLASLKGYCRMPKETALTLHRGEGIPTGVTTVSDGFRIVGRSEELPCPAEPGEARRHGEGARLPALVQRPVAKYLNAPEWTAFRGPSAVTVTVTVTVTVNPPVSLFVRENPMTRRILVTSALPYANGSIHLGHLVEYVYTDIWVRYLKMAGTTRTTSARTTPTGRRFSSAPSARASPPEELVGRYHEEHVQDFADFQIEFDCYHSTHSDENRQWAERVYQGRRRQGPHLPREIEQTYCPKDEMFLPDRFVRGTCPKCGAEDQYGDVCESCGATYAPTDLKDPHCSVCGTTPERRKSEHLFFDLGKLNDKLSAWTEETGHVQKEVTTTSSVG